MLRPAVGELGAVSIGKRAAPGARSARWINQMTGQTYQQWMTVAIRAKRMLSHLENFSPNTEVLQQFALVPVAGDGPFVGAMSIRPMPRAR